MHDRACKDCAHFRQNLEEVSAWSSWGWCLRYGVLVNKIDGDVCFDPKRDVAVELEVCGECNGSGTFSHNLDGTPIRGKSVDCRKCDGTGNRVEQDKEERK